MNSNSLSKLVNLTQSLKDHQRAINSVVEQTEIIHNIIQSIIQSLQQGGKILWCGNGGSAADAQHMAAELMVRYKINRKPLASIALTTDTSILTAHPNDYGFERVFARQVEGIAKPKDVLIGMSTSGKSKNIIQAMETARHLECTTIALVGKNKCELDNVCDITLHVESEETARIQEAHNFINHIICEGLDSKFGA